MSDEMIFSSTRVRVGRSLPVLFKLSPSKPIYPWNCPKNVMHHIQLSTKLHDCLSYDLTDRRVSAVCFMRLLAS